MRKSRGHFVFWHSARGLAHSKTLRVFQESSCRAQRLGLRRPSAAFPNGISNCAHVNWNRYIFTRSARWLQSKNHWEWFDKTPMPPYHPAMSRLRKENQAMKKNIKAIKSGAAPILGKYVKLIKTGEIVTWKSFDPKKYLFEVELPTGAVSIVHWREIERIGPDAESEFLRSREKNSK